jgi:hypothetical protein
VPVPVWPDALPDYVLESGYGEEDMETSVSNRTDSGWVETFPEITPGIEYAQCTMLMNGAQKKVLKEFYRDTLSGGALRFQWVHPDEQDVREMKMSRLTWFRADGLWHASFNLEIFPSI